MANEFNGSDRRIDQHITSAIESFKQIGCGCCTGDRSTLDHTGLAADRCTCHAHQDIRCAIYARKCSHHAA